MAKIRTVGDARRVWQRFGLAWSGGLPDYLFENAEALIKFEEKHAQELTTARRAAAQDAYEQAARLAETRFDDHWHSLMQEAGRIIAAKIRALAAAEAEKGDVEK